MFRHCSIDVKIVLFNSYCTPLYCSYVWTEYKKTSYSKIRVAFNNAYKRIFCLSNRSSASAMYANYNICYFGATLRKNIYNFIQRLENCTNSIIQVMMQSWYTKFEDWKHTLHLFLIKTFTLYYCMEHTALFICLLLPLYTCKQL